MMTVNQVKLLERLSEVTRNLNASTGLDAYLQSVLSAAVELSGSETAAILEYSEATQDFHFKSAPWFHHNAVADARVPASGSVAGWVYSNAKPAIINDTLKGARIYGSIDELPGSATRSLLGAPIILGGKPVGVFEVFNKAVGMNYTEEDALILVTLASLVSAAIQNDLLGNTVQSLQKEKRELDRLKNEFIAITSHELRTPLGLILGHSTFLRELIEDEYHEQVDAIIRNATRLKEIIESLSSVDNYQTGGASLRQQYASIARIVEDVVSSFREMAAQKNIVMKMNLPEDDELLVGMDTSKIAIVLSNLIKNAITFTNDGGKIVVSGDTRDGFVQIVVEDNGVGIPAKDLPLVFERFYQVESHLTRKHGGMGLGLSVAKGMIEMHGGRIWVDSLEGVGSKFTFLLPVDPSNATPGSSQPFG